MSSFCLLLFFGPNNVLRLFRHPRSCCTPFQVSELDMDTVGYGVLTLAAGLVFRVIVSFFSVMGGGLNLKERLFVALAWLPKATVQVSVLAHKDLAYIRAKFDGLTLHWAFPLQTIFPSGE